jgi:hypothetical protein
MKESYRRGYSSVIRTNSVFGFIFLRSRYYYYLLCAHYLKHYARKFDGLCEENAVCHSSCSEQQEILITRGHSK